MNYRLLLIVVIFFGVYFGVLPQKSYAQSCSGSGSSTYTNYRCAFDTITGYFCATNGTVTNSGSCSWRSGQCVFAENNEPRCSPNSTGTGCIMSNQCDGGDCYNPNGCRVTVAPTALPTPTVGANTPVPTSPPAGCAHWCATADQCFSSNGTVVGGTCGGTDVCCRTGGGTPPPPEPYCCGYKCPGANGNCCHHPWYGSCSTDAEWGSGFWACRDNPGGNSTNRCPCGDDFDQKGVHDATSCQYAATGWACDYDHNGPIRIRVLVNDQGTTRVIYDGPTSINRPDVQAAGECKNLDSGYAIPMPVQYMDGISRNFWVELPTDYSSCGDTRSPNSPPGAYNTNRTIACGVPTPTPIGLPTYCQINSATAGGVTYTGPFTMNSGETASVTYFGGGPSVVRSALYSSPVSAPNTWSLLGSGSAVNTSNFTCPATPGQYQLVCNSLRSDNSIACSGNPWTTGFPDCGPSDGLVVTCRAPLCNPSVAITPSGHLLDVGGPAQNFAISLSNTTGCTGLAVASNVENSLIASSTGLVSVGLNQYRYPVSGEAPGSTRVRVNLTNNGQPLSTVYGDVAVTCTPPNAPVSFTAADANFRIRLRWTNNDGTVTGFRILRDGATVVTLSASVANPPNYLISGNEYTYFDDVPGLCGTAHNYSIVAINANKPACSESTVPATAIGRCDNYEAWFGVGGGGSVAGNGEVRSRIPNWAPAATPPLPVFPPTYVSANNPNSGRPGYVMGGALSGFTNSQANSRGFVAGNLPVWTSVITRNENSYISMLDRATTRADARLVNQGSISNQGNWNSMVNSGGATNIVTLLDGRQVRLVRNQLGGGTMTIDFGQSDRTLNIPNPVLLFVDGNVQINNLIDVNNNSFLAIIASGNINVSPQVGDSATYVELQSGVPVTLNYNPNTGAGIDMRTGSYTPHLEGVFFAGGTFSTGGIDTTLTNPAPFGPGRHRSLRIDGSVIGMTGVNLQRDVRGPYPSIYVEFRPDFVYVLHQIGLRRKIYQELLSP